jgi:hypothetical protein
MNKKESIFTIGDKTNNGIISKFEIDSNGVRVFFEEKPINYHVNLNTLKHVEKLFTTEDGVDIYEGDSFYFVTESFVIVRTTVLTLKNSNNIFSTRKAAEEYILRNKPSLSINEVLDFLEGNPKVGKGAHWKYNKTSEKVIEGLKSLIKNKNK